MNLTNRELRSRARDTLGNKIFGSKWIMALGVTFVLTLIMNLPNISFEKSFAIDTHTTFTYSFSLSLGTIFLSGPVLFGLHKTFLLAARRKKDMSFDTAFNGFKQYRRTFLLGFLQNLFVTLWSLLFIIPGIVKTYSYSMSYYIMLDNPDYTWKECLNESQKMMDGQKWKLFCLDLSFIGWYIVGGLALGIGILWVEPYQYAARAEFYNALKGDITPPEEDYDDIEIPEEPINL